MEIPRPEPPHGALGALQARSPHTNSMNSIQASRTKAVVPTVRTPTKPSRKKSIYAPLPGHRKKR